MKSAKPSPLSVLYYIGLLYFPGTLLHELSHYLAARLFRVPVLSFSIFPRITTTGIIFGQVSIQRVDPFRRALVAIAPLVIGAVLLYGALQWIIRFGQFNAPTAIVCYIALCLLNMMIPSRQDITVALPGLLLTGIVIMLILILLFTSRLTLY
ncbi:hypothetical protein KBD68_01380 [Candidatus Woesebacteria bacterium]|nr:hypothetical protein [Candidatus Woesebacteria bacterium]